MQPPITLAIALAAFASAASGAAIPDQDTDAKSLVTRAPAPETMTRVPTAAAPVPTTFSTSAKPVDTGAPSWVLGEDPTSENDDCEMEMHIGTAPWPIEEFVQELPELRVCVDDPDSFGTDEPMTPEMMKKFWHQKCRLTKTVAISPAKPGCKSYNRKVTIEKGVENDQDYLNAGFKPLRRPKETGDYGIFTG